MERCENHEPHPVLNPGFQKIIIPICRHSSYAQSASRKLRTRCQKARSGHCSSIHRLPTNSEGTVPVVKENFYKVDLRLPHQRHTFTPSQPFNLSSSRQCLPKETFQVTQCSSSLGTPQKTNHPKQKYFILKRLKAKVSHIMLSLLLHLRNVEKVRS